MGFNLVGKINKSVLWKNKDRKGRRSYTAGARFISRLHSGHLQVLQTCLLSVSQQLSLCPFHAQSEIILALFLWACQPHHLWNVMTKHRSPKHTSPKESNLCSSRQRLSLTFSLNDWHISVLLHAGWEWIRAPKELWICKCSLNCKVQCICVWRDCHH